MKQVVKWMDDESKEVKSEKATQALISEYDDEDNLISETFGGVKKQVDEQPQEE